MHGDRVLLLMTTGRRTGQSRTAPVMFVQHDGDPMVMASGAGATTHPAWFLDLAAEAAVTVETSDGRTTPSRAEVLEGETRERAWRDLLKVASFFADHQRKAGARRIPLVVLHPER